MTTAIRLYRTYILSTFVPLNTIRRAFGFLFAPGTRKVHSGYTKNLCESLQTVGMILYHIANGSRQGDLAITFWRLWVKEQVLAVYTRIVFCDRDRPFLKVEIVQGQSRHFSGSHSCPVKQIKDDLGRQLITDGINKKLELFIISFIF